MQQTRMWSSDVFQYNLNRKSILLICQLRLKGHTLILSLAKGILFKASLSLSLSMNPAVKKKFPKLHTLKPKGEISVQNVWKLVLSCIQFYCPHICMCYASFQIWWFTNPISVPLVISPQWEKFLLYFGVSSLKYKFILVWQGLFKSK